MAGARECYQKAIEADAQFLQPLLQLAILAAGERQWREVERLTELVLARNRFELAAAEKSVRRAMELRLA